MGQVSIFYHKKIQRRLNTPIMVSFDPVKTKKTQYFSHQILDILGFGGDEGGGDAAVKRQAEGFANPMYQLANLMGQVIMTITKKIDQYKYQKCAPEQRKYYGVNLQN